MKIAMRFGSQVRDQGYADVRKNAFQLRKICNERYFLNIGKTDYESGRVNKGLPNKELALIS